jgi:phage-related protein
MEWNIELYQKENGEVPVLKFLENLSPKHKAKAFWEIELLKEFGTSLKEPYSKAIKGDNYKGLWELRVKFASDISRIFYFLPLEKTFILLHGFVKKTEKTPKAELEIAKNFMEDYLGRCK